MCSCTEEIVCAECLQDRADFEELFTQVMSGGRNDDIDFLRDIDYSDDQRFFEMGDFLDNEEISQEEIDALSRGY